MENKEQAQAAEQGQVQETKQPNMDELTAQIREEVTAELKSQLDGLNRTVGKLTKEKEEIAEAAKREAEAKLTVSERLKLMEQKLEASETKAAEEHLNSIMTKKAIAELEAAGLPTSVIDKIDISSDESIAKDIEFYQMLLSGYEKAAKDDVRKKHAFKPGSGEAVKSVPNSLADCKTKEEKIAYLKSKRE